MLRYRRPSLAPLSIVLLLSLLPGCQTNGSHSGNDGSVRASGSSGADVRKVVTDLLEQHRQALLNHDFATMERLWADDLTFINHHGQRLTKAQRVANLRSGATKFASIEVEDQVIRVYGDNAAVSTSRVNIKGKYSGQEGAGSYGTTVMCARVGGTWQMVALQMTRVEQ